MDGLFADLPFPAAPAPAAAAAPPPAPALGPVTLLAWNILHGGGSRRAPGILLELLASRADVIVLTEFRATMGGQLAAGLAEHGWAHQAWGPAPTCDDRGNRVFVASRLPVDSPTAADAPPPPPPPACLTGRWLDLSVAHGRFLLSGIHIPDDSRPGDKARAWRFLVDLARVRRDRPWIVLGDMNTGRHGIDEPGRRFGCVAMLGTLLSLGYVDAWRALHPGVREGTWKSHAGNDFRLDAAYISPALAGALRGASHADGARAEGWSDHAPLRVELDLAAGAPARN